MSGVRDSVRALRREFREKRQLGDFGVERLRVIAVAGFVVALDRGDDVVDRRRLAFKERYAAFSRRVLGMKRG